MIYLLIEPFSLCLSGASLTLFWIVDLTLPGMYLTTAAEVSLHCKDKKCPDENILYPKVAVASQTTGIYHPSLLASVVKSSSLPRR